MVFQKISTKNFLEKKIGKKNFEKTKTKKMRAKREDKFGLGFTVYLKSLPPPTYVGGWRN